MAPKPIPWRLYAKMTAVFVTFAVGGPALIYYVSPSEAELFAKYNPELQKRSLENRYQKQKDFDEFVGKLKEYSKGNKPIWEEAALAERRGRDAGVLEQAKLQEEIVKRKKEMKAEGIKGMPGGSL